MNQPPPALDAIPTTGVKGVRFRSRLEARWAAFFTLCGWPWVYEPDLKSYKWIPDFALMAGPAVLVEIKPALGIDHLLIHRNRIEDSGIVAQVALLGAAPTLLWPTKPVGSTKVKEDRIPMPNNTRVDTVCGLIGFDGGSNTWAWRVLSITEIAPILGLPNPVDYRHAQRLWIRAGNALQWKGH